MRIEHWQLEQRWSLPLEVKIKMSENRIRQWHEYYSGNTYVSFSGGKDSTVLLNLVRSLYPKTVAVFSDTGLEYPEIKEFVETIDNIICLKPTMTFKKVLETYGFPVVSKEVSLKVRQARTLAHNSKSYKLRMTGITSDGRYSPMGKIPEKWKCLVKAPFNISEKCCDIIKKNPMHNFEKQYNLKPYIGLMASDSRQRKMNYLKIGCNAYDGKTQSNPLGFWREEDIWNYIRKYNLSYSKIYDMGYARTGCMFCMFGIHMEKGKNRFQIMKKTHPKQYNYCINKLQCGKVLDYIGINY